MQPVGNHGIYNRMAGLEPSKVAGSSRLARLNQTQGVINNLGQSGGQGLPQGGVGNRESFIIPEGQRMDKLRGVFDEKTLNEIGAIECQTCSERRYQDGSNDPGVSFKSPQHISPEMSGPMVMAHEMEHVVREQAKAESEDREVISQNVQIYTAICPECGKSYVSGGLTTTVTGGKNEPYSPVNESNSEGNLLDVTL